jgi:agmatine deiminase
VNPTTVLCVIEDDRDDENYDPLKENYEILRSSTDQDGKPLTVIPLPTPGRVGGEVRLPASYANFYIGNTVVLVPTFKHPNDAAALARIRQAFPGRKVIGIDCTALVEGMGGVHCITLQQPSISSGVTGHRAESPSRKK